MHVAGPGKPGQVVGGATHVLILQAAPKTHQILVHVVAAALGQIDPALVLELRPEAFSDPAALAEAVAATVIGRLFK